MPRPIRSARRMPGILQPVAGLLRRAPGSAGTAVLTLAVAAALAGCSPSATPEQVIADARSALERRDTSEAEIALKDLLQREPDRAEARLLLGRIHARNGDLRSAEKELRRAIEGGASHDVVGPLLLEALVQIGEAQKAVDEAATLKPESPEGRAAVATQVGRAQAALRRPEEARAAYEQALAAKPDHVPATAGLVALRIARGDRAGAAAELDRLLAGTPDAPELLSLAADLDLAAGRLEPARERLARLVGKTPDDLPSRARLAAVLIDLRQDEAAAAELAELQRRAPGSPITLQLQGLHELRRGNVAAAREAAQQALKVAPDYAPVLALAASVALADGSPALAERHARQLLDRIPDSAQAARLLVAAQLRNGDPDRALQTAQQFLSRTGTENGPLLALSGEAALRMGDFARATAFYERAAKLDPDDAARRTGLAIARLSAGDRDRGFAELESATHLESGGLQAAYALAAARLNARDWDKALAAIDALAQKQPKDPTVPNMRGAALAGKGDVAGARRAFEAAVALSPGYFPAAANLAALDLREGKPADARRRYEAVLATDAKNVQALLALAQMEARSGGKRETRRELLERARQAAPDAPGPALALASLQLESGAPREAITMLQDALSRDPQRGELLELLGLAYARAGDRVQALEAYDRLARSAPRSAPVQMRVGELRTALGEHAAALAAFRRAAELAPQAVEPRMAMAASLVRQGKRAEAQQVASALRKDLPRHPAGLLLEGDLAAHDGKWTEAVDAFRKANAVANTDLGATRLHQALMRAGREPEADSGLRQYLKDRPGATAVRLYWSEQLIARKRWLEASEQLRSVLQQEPRNPIALNNLAWVLHQQRDAKALDLAEQAYALAPQAAPVIDTLGVILSERGDAARGAELLRQAVALAPKEPRFRLHLAQALLRQGEKNGAREQLDSLLKDYPSGPVADAVRDLGRQL